MEDRNRQRMTGAGMATGMTLGMILGVALENIGVWMVVGALLGAAFGAGATSMSGDSDDHRRDASRKDAGDGARWGDRVSR
jgi:uncharacterized membrane protein